MNDHEKFETQKASRKYIPKDKIETSDTYLLQCRKIYIQLMTAEIS